MAVNSKPAKPYNLAVGSLAITVVADTTAPSAPVISAAALSDSQIRVTIVTPSTDTGGSGVAGYRIFRNGSTSVIATLAPNATFYDDPGLTSGQSYSYQARAFDGATNISALSNTAVATALDTVAPTAPSLPVPSSVTANTAVVSCGGATDNVGVTGYESSLDGSSWTNRGNVSSFTQTGLSPSTAYTVRVRAYDAAGNRGPSTSSASFTTLAAGPVWNTTIPDQALTVGVPFSLDLDTVCTGAAAGYSIIAGALPAGLTLNETTGVISGTPTTAGTSSPTFRASDSNFDTDFAARAGASGVFYSNNFTYRNTAKTLLIASSADLRGSAYQVDGTAAQLVWDTTNKLSGGGSVRVNLPAASPGSFASYNFSFDGIATTTKNTSKHQFYVQFSVFADSVYRDFFFGDSNSWGGKIFIIQAPDRSFEKSEVVIRRSNRTGGFIDMYRYTDGVGGGADGVQTFYASESNYAYNNFIDRGGAFNTQSLFQQRFGPDYAGQNDPNAKTDPDLATHLRLLSNQWVTIEVYVDQVNDIIKVWMAPYGQAPTLLMGTFNARLAPVGQLDGSGANPKPIYTGCQMTLYPNTATAWPSTDTFFCYDEVICSDNPINFPGGFALPLPGTTAVPGFPYAGGVDQ